MAPTRRRPRIAINGLFVPGDGPGATDELRLKTRYVDSVRAAGGLPLPLALLEPDEVEELLDDVDGLLLTGGDDFDTLRLGLGPIHPAADPTPAEKQDFDMALARAALGRGLPVLGICYGMQTLALAEGASLLQHLPEDRPGCQEHAGGALHPVRIRPETKLAALCGVSQVAVVSRHHQAVGEPGPGWTVTATDEEGLIEAIEREDHPFAVGVQWHPELSPHEPAHRGLFEGLVAAAFAPRGASGLEVS